MANLRQYLEPSEFSETNSDDTFLKQLLQKLTKGQIGQPMEAQTGPGNQEMFGMTANEAVGKLGGLFGKLF